MIITDFNFRKKKMNSDDMLFVFVLREGEQGERGNGLKRRYYWVARLIEANVKHENLKYYSDINSEIDNNANVVFIKLTLTLKSE